ncbi:MAG: hypothetical protein IKL36_01835, partial [Clostridia bacterium]|nr:hypothetical protein [Clostridia bacterium]
MINSESGRSKQNRAVRFLAFCLAIIMMLGAFAVVPVLSVDSEPEAEQEQSQSQSQSAQNNSEIKYTENVLKIILDGEEKSVLEIYDTEKVEIRAEGVLAEKYQWQMLHPEQSGLWVDIYEATNAILEVSYALTKNMIHKDGKAYLRCLAYTTEGEDNGAYVTDVLSVSTLEGTSNVEEPEMPKLKVAN